MAGRPRQWRSDPSADPPGSPTASRPSGRAGPRCGTVGNIGLRSHYVASIHAARPMVNQGKGLIVNVSSAAAANYFLSVAYGVGKAALDRMTADTAIQLSEHGVAVVSIWPARYAPRRPRPSRRPDWRASPTPRPRSSPAGPSSRSRSTPSQRPIRPGLLRLRSRPRVRLHRTRRLSTRAPHLRRSSVVTPIINAPAEERILEAALRCFRRWGVAKTSMGEIADAAGMQRPQLYRHFDNKEALIVNAIVRQAQQLSHKRLEAFPLKGPVEPIIIETLLVGHNDLLADEFAGGLMPATTSSCSCASSAPNPRCAPRRPSGGTQSSTTGTAAVRSGPTSRPTSSSTGSCSTRSPWPTPRPVPRRHRRPTLPLQIRRARRPASHRGRTSITEKERAMITSHGNAATTIRTMYEDALAGRYEAAFGAVTEDFVLEEPPVLPYGGTYNGPEGFGTALRQGRRDTRLHHHGDRVCLRRRQARLRRHHVRCPSLRKARDDPRGVATRRRQDHPRARVLV